MPARPDPRQSAHDAVTDAVRAGLLRPTPCVLCLSWPTVAHHPRGWDEDHRLDVVWLCEPCHAIVHPDPIQATLEHAYRAMRERAKVSLRELSRRTGINPGRLSIIERGVPPTAEEAAAIDGALATAIAS